MEKSSYRTGVRAAMVAALVMSLAAAPALAANSQKGKTKSVEQMAEFRAQLEEISKQIDVTMGSLNNVVEQKGGDPRPAFTQFEKEHDKMLDQVKDIQANAKALRKQGEKLFAEWQKQMGTMTNEAIKARAEERKAALQGFFDKVKSSMEAGKAAAGPFAAELKDIRTYLTNDLTPAGIDSMQDIITQATTNGTTIKTSISEVITAVDAFKAEISPTGTQ